MIHITDTAAHTFTAVGCRITINTGFTGTITLSDNNGTQAIVTNPVTGGEYIYHGFLGPVSVTASATGDITVSTMSSERHR